MTEEQIVRQLTVTDESDMFVYLEIIEQLGCKSVLDIGMFLNRIGAVTRHIMNRSIPGEIELDAIACEGDITFPVMTTIYNHIYAAGELPQNQYDLAIYLDHGDVMMSRGQQVYLDYMLEHADKILVDGKNRAAEEYLRTRTACTELSVDTHHYVLADGYKENETATRKVSVIIPCYNVTKWFEQCVESVLHQTIGLAAIELILVNDASTDDGRTWEILSGYEEKYPENILLINLDVNMRQGGARNAALEYATGEYVAFLDADDWMREDMLERTVALAQQTNADLVQFGHYIYTDKYGVIAKKKQPGTAQYDINSHTERIQLLMNELLTYGCWNKLYRRSLIESCHARYAEHVIYEEPLFVYPMLFQVNRVVTYEECLYYYRQNPSGTMMHDMAAGKAIEQHAQVQLQVYEQMKQSLHYAEYKAEIDFYFLHTYFFETMFFLIQRGGQVSLELFDELGSKVKEQLCDYRNNPYLAQPQYAVQRHLLEQIGSCKVQQDVDDCLEFLYQKMKG